jgi:hypothetical protein
MEENEWSRWLEIEEFNIDQLADRLANNQNTINIILFDAGRPSMSKSL